MSDRELTLPSSDTHAARRHLGAALVRLVHDLQRAPLPSEPIAAADARAAAGVAAARRLRAPPAALPRAPRAAGRPAVASQI